MTEPEEDRIIGTEEAARLLGMSRRTVQRMVAEWVKTDTAPIQISTVGNRGEYMFHASDIEAIKAIKAAKTP